MKMRAMILMWGVLAGAASAEGLVACHMALDDAAFATPDPTAGHWEACLPAQVVCLPQAIATPSKFTVSAPTLDVRAVHNGRWIGLRVRWADATRDEQVGGDAFSDAVAVALPVGEKQTTSPFMGGPGTPLEILHWKAVWQRDVEHGYADVADHHPHAAVARYHGSTTTQEHALAEVMQSEEARLASPAIRLGNPVSQIQREFPVEQLAAAGFTGSLTTQNRQDARAWGVYAEDHWTVVFTRPLDTGDDQDRPLRPGDEHELNLAVWDGTAGDVGARKSYTMFIPLHIEALP